MKLQFVAAAIAAGVCVGAAQAQWLSPWGNGGAASPGIDGGPVDSPVVDPFGDAQDAFGAGPPLLDIDTISVNYDATNLYMVMTFHTPIAPASAGVAESLFGVFEFDTDQNALTGALPLQNVFSPPFDSLNLGIDFALDFVSELAHPGQFDIIDVNFGPVGTVDAVFGDMSVSTTIPLSLLGDDDGALHFATIIGTGPQPTDAINVIGASIPTPGAVTLLAIGACAAARRRR